MRYLIEGRHSLGEQLGFRLTLIHPRRGVLVLKLCLNHRVAPSGAVLMEDLFSVERNSIPGRLFWRWGRCHICYALLRGGRKLVQQLQLKSTGIPARPPNEAKLVGLQMVSLLLLSSQGSHLFMQ